jgi:hypothetical protein
MSIATHIRLKPTFGSRYDPDKSRVLDAPKLKENNNNKENKDMNDFGMGDMGKMFKGMFGPIEAGKCKLGMNGKIAIKTPNGYKTYDAKKNRLTNVGTFAFDMFNMFWLIPTNTLQVGDIILMQKGDRRVPRFVIKVDNGIITALDYEDNELKQVLPERHILMGKVFFYAKIWCPFKGMASNGNMFSQMFKMQLMSQMMNGMMNGGNVADAVNPMGNMGQMFMMPMMMQLMGGMFGGKADNSNPFAAMFGGEDGENPFASMFSDLDFSGAEDATEEEKAEAENDEEE